MSKQHLPLALIILDGWGHREQKEFNAIAAASTPHWQQLWQRYPHTLISGSGLDVGLPAGQMGNSEVGHLNIGAGRVVYQDFTRIEQDIIKGGFFNNPVLNQAVKNAVVQNKAVHILGLLSPGGVHSHERHLHAMAEMAVKLGCEQLYIHAFLDGRDMPPKSAGASIVAMEEKLAGLGRGRIASIIGRYYAMDRDKRWERVQAAYELIAAAKAAYQAPSAMAALEMAYARGETDEFVQATAISANDKSVCAEDGDVIIFMNYRADRGRELTHAFTDPDFSHFPRIRYPQLAEYVTLTRYAANLDAAVAYPPQPLNNVLGEYLAQQGYRQLRAAETEKYGHVTFFFNGGREVPYPNEDRILVPSPKVATYDLQPQMSAYELTAELVAAIKSGKYDFIVCNYANPDMVGHTGDFKAAVAAIEVIDDCLGKIIAALQEVGGEAIITADHGNAECMRDEGTQQPHTAHTSEPVPFIYIGRPAKVIVENGMLADVAPTILHILGLPQPQEMTGQALVQLV